MKKSIILEIFNGKRGNIDSIVYVPKDESSHSAGFEKLKESFNNEQLELFERSLDEFATHLFDEVDFYFVEGFKLGLLLGIECMDD